MIRIIKCVYNDETDFILEILNEFSEHYITESFNADDRKQVKKARIIQTAMGTKRFPLVVFEDQNLVEVTALWPENTKDWKKEILNKLKEDSINEFI